MKREKESIKDERDMLAENKYYIEQTQSSYSPTVKSENSSFVKGNTDLPQIRELNEIAAMLRSM